MYMHLVEPCIFSETSKKNYNNYTNAAHITLYYMRELYIYNNIVLGLMMVNVSTDIICIYVCVCVHYILTRGAAGWGNFTNSALF